VSDFESPERSGGGFSGVIGRVGDGARLASDFVHGLAEEGVSGAMDTGGMLDRIDARRDLAGRFSVLDPLPQTQQVQAARAAAQLQQRGPGRAEAIVSSLNGKPLEERARILAAYEATTGQTLDASLHEPDSGVAAGHPLLGAGFADQHNVLTQDQFEAVARLYSDVRLGRTDLDLTGLTERERAPAMSDLGDILQTESGRGLVRALAHHQHNHRTVLESLDEGARAGDARVRANAWTIKPGIGEVSPEVAVRYRPGVTDDYGFAHPWTEGRSDRILYHELVHAYHGTHGTEDARPLTAATGATGSDAGALYETGGVITNTEYQAVGLGQHARDRFTENRYAAERRAIGATNLGERTGDDDQRHRDRYVGTYRVGHRAANAFSGGAGAAAETFAHFAE
jgi:hypothetical protein